MGLYAQRARGKKCESMPWVWFNDPMKIMCFEHKTRMVDHRIKILKKINYFFLLHCDLHSLKVLHNKWCSSHYLCIPWKETIKRFSEPKKEGYNILLNVLLVYFSFWLKNYFDMCFDHLIKIYVSHDHYYSTSHMIIKHLYLYKHVLNVMTIYFQKEKKHKHLNNYLSNDLNKMKQKIK